MSTVATMGCSGRGEPRFTFRFYARTQKEMECARPAKQWGRKTKPRVLEAEAAAWCSKRGKRPVSVTGKVPVVRICGRAHRPTVRSRPLRVSENPQARQWLIRRKQAQRIKLPIPRRASWMAYIIAFLVLAVAFLTSPIWGTMYGGWRR